MQTLSKNERLSSITAIGMLFKAGRSAFAYPLRAVFLPNTDITQSRILVSVPKKRFKTAVARNNIKRKIREAYRKNKIEASFDIAFIYVSDSNMSYSKIEDAVKKILAEILNQSKNSLSNGENI